MWTFLKLLYSALILENCRRFNITNCSIFESRECGILLDNVNYVRVSDCMILNENKNKIALRLTNGINNMITNNLFNEETDIPPQSAQLENNLIIN
ncbi:right-handed parallel beta-helix repeat-containing protein [candidate division KSB1 bacterium]